MTGAAKTYEVSECGHCPLYAMELPAYGRCGVGGGGGQRVAADERPEQCPLERGPVVVRLPSWLHVCTDGRPVDLPRDEECDECGARRAGHG